MTIAVGGGIVGQLRLAVGAGSAGTFAVAIDVTVARAISVTRSVAVPISVTVTVTVTIPAAVAAFLGRDSVDHHANDFRTDLAEHVASLTRQGTSLFVEPEREDHAVHLTGNRPGFTDCQQRRRVNNDKIKLLAEVFQIFAKADRRKQL